MQIRLTWEDPATGEHRSPLLTVPIAIGRDFEHMPSQYRSQHSEQQQEQRVSRIVLDSLQVSRYHALIVQEGAGLVVIDQNSRNGVLINTNRLSRSFLAEGDTLQIGPYQITVSLRSVTTPATPTPATIAFHPETGLLSPPPIAAAVVSPAPVPTAAFPPPLLFQSQQIAVSDLKATGLPVQEFDYAALGAGLGSFIWVDLLRISGVRSSQIIALGLEDKPYARYQRLCQNSQIPPHERLRSNSDSCPDNIWGWPSYALREAWQDASQGKLGAASKYLWQVFAEPTFAETYTPRSGRVFAAIDREVQRIGWSAMFKPARIRSIRQTNDGRYVIAYSYAADATTTAATREYGFVVATYVHLATGYPAIQFLEDLQTYREQTRDFKTVVNAYEPHNHVYEQLEQQGGTVLIRGRGIVASRIIQRIYEARQRNPNISLFHLMRSPKPEGNQFGRARRSVKHHYELQPFNWPKACWGGDLRTMLEAANPQERQRLLSDWGGTTTADRRDWQQIVAIGLKQNWYQIVFGEVERVEPQGKGTMTLIREKNFKGEIRLAADFIVDATGLDAKVKANPLLEEVVNHYQLPLNPLGRLSVANDFEVVDLRSGQQGRFYAAGAITLGGPYAAVDSFLGLQYAALCSVDSLAAIRAPKLKRLNGFSSLGQWFKWVGNRSPN